MLVLILAGPSCVGKTTSANQLMAKSEMNAAFLDSEWAACYFPFDFTNRPMIMIENMCTCAKNYEKAGARLLILTFAHIDHVEDLRQRLHVMGFGSYVVSLVADNKSLTKRFEMTGCNATDPYLSVIFKLNNQAQKMKCDVRIDTSSLSIESVCDNIIFNMKSIAKA